ncbi:MAG TPA: LLM class F420-dependent oxidoreductase [Acidimicrobiia bacterium]|nr:LLM class F420-dependent oxidoreductase [Acidimicrobiia bacterium]
MRADIGAFGVWRMVSGITPELAEQVEALGYGAIWLGGSPTGDLEAVEVVLDATERIPVATGIVNMWREDAATVAESYRRVSGRHAGRFLLGVGVGHREATQEYHKPYDKMVDYLDRLDAAAVPQEDVVLAALGPRALTLAAERTSGAHPYLTTPRHTDQARLLIGRDPLLAPEQKVVLETDATLARAIGRPVVSRYLTRINYRSNLLREGWAESDLEAGGSDRLVDALVLHGTSEDIAAGLTAHLDAGADHVAIQVLGDDPLDGYRQLSGVLIAV